MLDHELVEFAATIPADVKFKSGDLKRVLKKVGGGVLPDSVLAREDKMGFPLPLNDWLSGPCNDWVREVFQTGAAIGRDHVDASAIPALLDAESRFGRTMWGYLSLELWHQQFVDRPPTIVHWTRRANLPFQQNHTSPKAIAKGSL